MKITPKPTLLKMKSITRKFAIEMIDKFEGRLLQQISSDRQKFFLLSNGGLILLNEISSRLKSKLWEGEEAQNVILRMQFVQSNEYALRANAYEQNYPKYLVVFQDSIKKMMIESERLIFIKKLSKLLTIKDLFTKKINNIWRISSKIDNFDKHEDDKIDELFIPLLCWVGEFIISQNDDTEWYFKEESILSENYHLVIPLLYDKKSQKELNIVEPLFSRLGHPDKPILLPNLLNTFLRSPI